jgi:hypothetical protein
VLLEANPVRDAAASLALARLHACGELLHAGRTQEAEALRLTVDRDLTEEAAREAVVQARLRWFDGFRALRRGEAEEAVLCFEDAHRAFASAGDERRACNALCDAAFARSELGDNARAEAEFRTVLAKGERVGVIVVGAKQNLGLVLSRLGRLKEARQIETEAAELSRTLGLRRQEGNSRIYLAMILACSDELAAAESEARNATALLAETPPLLMYAFAVLSDILLARDRSTEALKAAQSAKAALDAGHTVEEGDALVRLTWAEALHASGDVAAACVAVRAARDRLLARASAIRDPELRRSFLESVPAHARTLAKAREWDPQATVAAGDGPNHTPDPHRHARKSPP